MHAATREPLPDRGFEPLGAVIILVVSGAVPFAILWLAGAPAWSWPLPIAAGFLLLLVLWTRARDQPKVAAFQRAAAGLLVRETESGPTPQWSEIPDEHVYGFTIETGRQQDKVVVFYEESEERPVAQRFAPLEDDEDLVQWLEDRYRRLPAKNLAEAENLKRVAERAKTRGWQKDVMSLPEDLRGKLKRVCETLLQLPVHSEVRYHEELIEQYLPQLGNLIQLLRKWVALKNPSPRPAANVAEDTLLLETFLAAARVVTKIRDQETDAAKRYRLWDLHFRPVCLATAQAAGSQMAGSPEPPIILGPPAKEKPVAPSEAAQEAAPEVPSEAPSAVPPAVPPMEAQDPLDDFPESPFVAPEEPVLDPYEKEQGSIDTVIEPTLPVQIDESWPKPVKDFVRETPSIPWLAARELSPAARELVLQHLHRIEPFREKGSTYADALAAAKKVSLDLREWAGWDPTEDDTWWIQFHVIRKRLDEMFGEARGGQFYARIKEVSELNLLWESAQPSPTEPNPWSPIIDVYRLGLSVTFDSVEPFGTEIEAPSSESSPPSLLEVALEK